MTLNEVTFLHAYNAWADNRVFDALAPLASEEYLRDLHSSHGGIHGTLTHLVGAEKVWLERWTGIVQPFLRAGEIPGLPALKEIWEKVGYDTAKFLGTMTDRKLQETFTMKTSRGDVHTHVYWQAFQHLVNHSSYHRGQIVAMMRQLGRQGVSTDLIQFYRETGKRA
jgi:uncharacterized damage-inducible protein DinB